MILHILKWVGIVIGTIIGVYALMWITIMTLLGLQFISWLKIFARLAPPEWLKPSDSNKGKGQF